MNYPLSTWLWTLVLGAVTVAAFTMLSDPWVFHAVVRLLQIGTLLAVAGYFLWNLKAR